MSYHNPKQTNKQKTHRRLNLNKRPSARTASHIRMPGVLLHSTLPLTPTNSTLEVYSFMWQICLGHCWMKWLLSPQTKHLLSFRARRPPRMMRILLGDAPSLMLLRCSAPDQAFLVRRLERCASRPMTLPRRPSPVAAGAVPCTSWDMVIISVSIFALMSPIAVLNSSRVTFAEASMVSVVLFFGALGTNRLVLETLEYSRV